MRIKYTAIGEGIIEDIFIPEYIKRIGARNGYIIERSKLKITSPNKEKVLSNILLLSKMSLIHNREDFFIAGVDLDCPDYSDNLLKHTLQIKELKEKLPRGIPLQKVILFVPIQAFDHWLLYQKHKVDIKAKKYPPNGLESMPKSKAKKQLYGEKKADRSQIEKVCNQIFKKINFEELASQSKSFKKFHNQVCNILS